MRHLTILVKDDITNLIHLYRKLAETNYDGYALYTAYDKKTQKFVIDSTLASHFPKLTFVGPTAIYEDYVTFANFPTTINLEDYNKNFLNVNIMDHLKTHHLNDIFPKQRTCFIHPLNINQEEFKEGKLDTSQKNICINVFDAAYDQNFALQYNLIYCLSELQDQFSNLHIHLIGIHSNSYNDMLTSVVLSTLETLNVPITTHIHQSLSYQVGILLQADGLISNPFGFGALAYTFGVKSLIIYPFHMEYLIGKTIDPTKDNSKYIESTDVEYIDDIEKFSKLLKG